MSQGWQDIYALQQYVREHPSENRPKRVLERTNNWGGGWGTCVPLLSAVVAIARPGGVVECGSGHFSTPPLIEICRAMGRRLQVFEHNAGWMEKLSDFTDLEISHVLSWAEFRKQGIECAVVFVDNQPDTERLANIEWASQYAEFVVVHDTLNPGFTGVDDRLSKFKYRSDYTDMTSCTSVVSDVRPYPGRRS